MVPIRPYSPFQYQRGGDPWAIGSELLNQPNSPIETYNKTISDDVNLSRRQMAERQDELNLEELERQYGQKERLRQDIAEQMDQASNSGKKMSMDEVIQYIEDQQLKDGEIDEALKLNEARQNRERQEQKDLVDLITASQKMAEVDPESAKSYYNKNTRSNPIEDAKQLFGVRQVYVDGEGTYRQYPDGSRELISPEKKTGRSGIKEFIDPDGNLVYIEYSDAADLNRQVQQRGLKRVNSDPFEEMIRERIGGAVNRSSQIPQPLPAPTPVPGLFVRRPRNQNPMER
jgi:hypothetical protein